MAAARAIGVVVAASLCVLALSGAARAASPSPSAAPIASPSVAPIASPSVAPIASPSVAPAVPPPASPDPALVLHVPVLMYHLVGLPGEVPSALPNLVVSPTTFDAHMRALHDAGWHTITAADLATYLAAGTRPPARSFVVTIDDGYADGYTHALPILEAYGFVATFYVVAGRVGGSAHTLSWPQVRELLAAGMDIGNHTVSHPALTAASDWDLGWQIRRAQEIVLRQTGYAMTTLAYPAGDFDQRVEDAVETAGLGLGFTTRPGALETWAGRFACPRIRVSPGTGARSLVGTLEGFADD